MIRVITCLFIIILVLPNSARADRLKPGSIAVVLDNGNNLRSYSGDNYKNAPILHVLNKDDTVKVLRQEGNWTEVIAATDPPDKLNKVQGWVHTKCLISLSDVYSDPKRRENTYCSKQLPHSFRTQLDINLPNAEVRIEDVQSLSGGGGRLVVKDASGKLLWRGPLLNLDDIDSSSYDPLFFNCTDIGIYWPSIIDDIDGDGRSEMIAADTQSDVSVSSFVVARWNGNAFVPIRKHESLVESPENSGRYLFQRFNYSANSPRERWIMRVTTLGGKGLVSASIYERNSGPKGDEYKNGEAQVRFDENGATVVKWINPLHAGTQ